MCECMCVWVYVCVCVCVYVCVCITCNYLFTLCGMRAIKSAALRTHIYMKYFVPYNKFCTLWYILLKMLPYAHTSTWNILYLIIYFVPYDIFCSRVLPYTHTSTWNILYLMLYFAQDVALHTHIYMKYFVPYNIFCTL